MLHAIALLALALISADFEPAGMATLARQHAGRQEGTGA
jgi:hypothetical protein